MSILDFTVGKTYNFQTYSPAVLGLTHKAMKCTGELSFDDVIRLYPNVIETFKAVYVDLPFGTVNNAKLATYFIFKNENGNSTYFADIWIKPETVIEVMRQTHTYRIADAGLTNADIQRIMRILNAAGYSNITYEVSYIGK